MYMDPRGYIYRLNEDNSQNFEPFAVCFATPNNDALVVYTTGVREGRLISGTACNMAVFVHTAILHPALSNFRV